MGLVILLTTILYSNYLATNLENSEERMKKLYKDATDFIATNTDLDAEIGLAQEIRSTFPLPIILQRPDGTLEGNGWGEERDSIETFLEGKIREFLKSGEEPMVDSWSGGKLYVFSSPIVRLIKFFPIIQILLVSVFIALGYYLFNTARRGEQNRVWAGMAKETAHQLGTPISAILAWVEHLKDINKESDEQLSIIHELENDIDRLNLIADRFSKIGSAPELEKTNVFEILKEIKLYMERRASRKVSFEFPYPEEPQFVNVNRHLFSWVLENLIRNALDAMDGKGVISAAVSLENKQLALNIKDTGKGIPHSKFKTVFKPGYSTKQRGWGLGLSLAKRIIENYHNGKIFVKNSHLNEGTTFTILLPRV